MHILIVDDDTAVLETVKDMVEVLGHTASTCPDGESALNFMSAAAYKIDVLLTDVDMPGMTGVELSRLAKSAIPGIRVMLVSGKYEGPDVGSEDVFLSKPFTITELEEKLEEQ